MTYKELKDSIITRYKLDSTMAGTPYIVLQDAWVYQLITQAESDIQLRTLVLTASDELTLGSATANTLPYSLPATFGKIRQIVSDSGIIYEYKTKEQFEEIQNLDETTDAFYTLYWDGTAHKLDFLPSPTTVTVTLDYYKAIVPFIDSSLTSASNLVFPPEYYDALEYRVMSNIFPKYAPMYENEMRRLREYTSVTPDANIDGNLGGY